MDTRAKFDSGQDNIYLRDILQDLWRHKLGYISFSVVCMLAVVIALIVVPRKYTALTVIDPVSESSNSQSGVLGSLTTGLSALAGLGSASDPRKVESVAILQSEALTERYIQQNDLMPILFPKLWDSSKSAWKTTDPAKTPTLWKAAEYFKKNIRSVTTEGKTGLVTLTITWKDPRQAATWANGLVNLANEYERDTAISKSEHNIAYLKDQAAATDVVGIRQVIYSLLENEINRAMIARGDIEYGFKIIDPASIPERPSYPDKIVWPLVTIFTTLSLSVFYAFLRVSIHRE